MTAQKGRRGFQKGKSGNPKGKVKGLKNKKTQQWEAFAEWFMSEGMSRLKTEMATLSGKDYVNTTKDLLEYFKPRLARTELSGDEKKPLAIQFYLPQRENMEALPEARSRIVE